QSIAGTTISFIGEVSDKKLRDLYASAKAVIFPQEEDFGLVPLEAQAAGTPVLAFATGGALETVINQQTGLFFDKQNKDSIIEAINRFEEGKHRITRQKCRKQAERFNENRFISNFSAKVNSLWQQHMKNLS
ncbi:glycosyltransferase, partial [Candidatus Collierbacteria bacterium]|nr:glycosyltransferase [Candidatus Collierbacteria bacterium]